MILWEPHHKPKPQRQAQSLVPSALEVVLLSRCSVVWVFPAFAVGETDVGFSEIGAVVNDYAIVREELHVHGCDSDAFFEDGPGAVGGGEWTWLGGDEEVEEEDD
ncbi:hypothetical protein LXL04_031533 [Taraxacum kok-saghyz]